MHITINSNSIDQPDLIKQLDWIYDNKFDGVELACSSHPKHADTLWHWDRKFERPNVHALRNGLCGFKSQTVHANSFSYYDETYCGLHPLCREIAIDDAIFAMDLATEVRAETVTVHSGWLCYGRTPEEREAALGEGLKRLNRLAKAKSIMLGVKNVDYFAVLDRFRLLADLELDHVGITLDVGAALSAGTGIPVEPSDTPPCESFGGIEGFIKEFGTRIIHVHVHDVKDGQVGLPLGKGEVDIQSIVTALAEVGYDRALCLQPALDRATPEEIIDSKERLRGCLAG